MLQVKCLDLKIPLKLKYKIYIKKLKLKVSIMQIMPFQNTILDYNSFIIKAILIIISKLLYILYNFSVWDQ